MSTRFNLPSREERDGAAVGRPERLRDDVVADEHLRRHGSSGSATARRRLAPAIIQRPLGDTESGVCPAAMFEAVKRTSSGSGEG